MNVSQEIRNTLTKSGDWMSVDEITDAIGGLADKSFVQAICIQHAKKGAFGRAREDGRMVYRMVDPKNVPVDEPIVDAPEVVQAETVAEAAVAATVEVSAPKVVHHDQVRKAIRRASASVRAPAPAQQEPALGVATIEAAHQQRLVTRATHTSYSVTRTLTDLLADAIEARMDHEALARICNAQQAVQDVYDFLMIRQG